MKRLNFKGFIQKTGALLMVLSMLVACGNDNSTGGRGIGGGLYGIGGLGAGGVLPGTQVPMQQIFQQIQCRSSAGPQAFQVASYIQGPNGQFIPSNAQINVTADVYMGASYYGDVIMVTPVQQGTLVVMKVCERAGLSNGQIPASLQLLSQPKINSSHGMCGGINEVTQALIRLNYQVGSADVSYVPLYYVNQNICNMY